MADTPRLYTDVAASEATADKEKLLKQIAESGRRSLADINKADAQADQLKYDYYDEELQDIKAVGGPSAVAGELDAWRERLTAGSDRARSDFARHHSDELDRIAAAAAAYKEKLAAAIPIHENWLKSDIEAQRLAAAQRARGGGGSAADAAQAAYWQWMLEQARGPGEPGTPDAEVQYRDPRDFLYEKGEDQDRIVDTEGSLQKWRGYLPQADRIMFETQFNNPLASVNDGVDAVYEYYRGLGASHKEAVDMAALVSAKFGVAAPDTFAQIDKRAVLRNPAARVSTAGLAGYVRNKASWQKPATAPVDAARTRSGLGGIIERQAINAGNPLPPAVVVPPPIEGGGLGALVRQQMTNAGEPTEADAAAIGRLILAQLRGLGKIPGVGG